VWLCLRIFAFAAAVPVLLHLKLPRVATLLEPRQAPVAPAHGRVQTIITCVDLVLQIGRPLVRRGCLTRGLTLYYFLRRAGLELTLCFGLGQVREAFVGHCWLVHAGEPFLEARDPRPVFTVLYRLPDPGRTRGPAGQRHRGSDHTHAA
jgi:hypothetical protein